MSRRIVRTDELFDRFLFRPLASVVVWLVKPTPVTANQMTVVAALFGVAAGIALGLREAAWAAAFVGGYLVLDCTDGQLARLRGGSGIVGRLADAAGDFITAIAIHLGLLAGIGQAHGWIEGVLWSIAAFVSLSWCSTLLDRYKRRYKDDADDLDAVRAIAAGKGWWAFVARIFLPYTHQVAADIDIPDRDRYRERVGGLLGLWLLGGPTGHFVALGICAAFGDPRLYAMLACGPFNLLTAITLLWQRRAERRPPAVVGSA